MSRSFAIILLFTVGQLFAQQELIIDERYEDVSLYQVLGELKEKYDLKFAYNKKLVQDLIVTADIRKERLSAALDLLLEGSGLEYDLVSDRAVILKKREEKVPQYYSVTGSVRDSQSGESMPFAHVYTSDKSLSTTSNEHGYFTLTGLSDTTTLHVSFVGYPEQRYRISPASARERQVFSLNGEASVLEEVVVSDEISGFAESRNPGVVSIDPKVVNWIPTTAERDPVRALSLMSGVNSKSELSVGLEIQGGTSTQNLISFDGFTVYHLDHFFGYFSAINPHSVKHQRLFKTGYSAKYGGGVSGILQFVGKEGNKEKLSGKLAISQMSVNSSLEVPVSDNTTLFLSARRSYSDFLMTSLFDKVFEEYRVQLQDEGDYNSTVTIAEFDPEFHFNDFNFKLSSQLSPRTRAAFSLYSSEDRLDFREHVRVAFPIDSTVNYHSQGNVEWGNIGASGSLTRYWNSDHFSELFVSFSGYRSDYSDFTHLVYVQSKEVVGEDFDEDIQSNGIEDFSVDLDHEWHLPGWLLETGLNATIYSAHIRSEYNDEEIINKRQDHIGLFTHYFQLTKPIGNTEVGMGMRSNYLQGMDQFYFEPRFKLNYQFNEKWSGNAAVGVHRQFVNQIVTQNTIQGSRDLWTVADFQVPDQRSLQFSAGFNYVGSREALNIGYFHKTFNGVLDFAFSLGNRLTEYENYEKLFFGGNGFARGVETMYQFRQGNFEGLAAYTYKVVRYQFDDLNAGRAYPADNDQRHEVKLFGQWNLGKFDVSSTWIYGSGLPYTEFGLRQRGPNSGLNTGPNQNPPPMNDEAIFLVPTDDRNSQRFDPYHRLDLAVGYSRRIGKLDSRFTVNVFNLYDRDNYYDRQIRFDPVPVPGGPPPNSANQNQPPPQPQGPGFDFFDLALLSRTVSFGLEVSF